MDLDHRSRPEPIQRTRHHLVQAARAIDDLEKALDLTHLRRRSDRIKSDLRHAEGGRHGE
jgi:hypothetical protein